MGDDLIISGLALRIALEASARVAIRGERRRLHEVMEQLEQGLNKSTGHGKSQLVVLRRIAEALPYEEA